MLRTHSAPSQAMLLDPDLIATREEFELALTEADAMPRFDGKAAWAAVCGAFRKVDLIRGFSKREQLAYAELARPRDLSALGARVKADIASGSVCAAFAALSQGLPRGWPLAIWACPPDGSMHDRPSLALLRIVLWMGFDFDARDGDGHSAMDLMLGARRGRHCQPRGVAILLEAGADPDAIGPDGDSPLLSLARAEHWCEDRDVCVRSLIEHGADTLAAHGSDRLPALLRSMQARRPSSLRAELIAELDGGERAASGLSRIVGARCDDIQKETLMADDKTKTGPQDASKINVHEDYEVTYWTKKFGCTAAELRAAVKAVGTGAKAVEAHLKKK